MPTPLPVRCMVCRAEFDYWRRYGREGCACNRDCYKQFELRRARTILGRPADENEGAPVMARQMNEATRRARAWLRRFERTFSPDADDVATLIRQTEARVRRAVAAEAIEAFEEMGRTTRKTPPEGYSAQQQAAYCGALFDATTILRELTTPRRRTTAARSR